MSTPIEANRTLTTLSAVFGFADFAGTIPVGDNPCRHVERYEETGERRALTESELSALGKALSEAEEASDINPSPSSRPRVFPRFGWARPD